MDNKNQELEKKINAWWSNLRRLQKLDILMESYSSVSIETIENQGIHTLWNRFSLEKKSVIMEMYEKERRKERG